MRLGWWMRLVAAGSFALAVSGCGGSSGSTLLVRCDGGTAVVGAASVDVAADAATRSTVIRYPDPLNEGKTGSIPIPQGQSCKVTIDKTS